MFKWISKMAAVSMLAALASLQPTQGHAYDSVFTDCCDPCDDCCDRFWFDADYLYWKIKNSPEPVPLVVGQNAKGQPFTGTFLGDRDIDLGWRSGGKFALGYWFDNSGCLGIECNYFFLGNKSKQFGVGTADNLAPRLRIPYFDVNLDAEDSIALSTPGRFAGNAYLKLKNSMQGAELNVIALVPSCDPFMSFGLLAGFRYWNFDEDLKFIVNSGLVSTPSIFNTIDKFNVQNNFYGGQLGASFDYHYCSFFFNLKGKVALGAMYQKLGIHGAFETNEISDTATGALVKYPGGIFALPSNIGNHKKTRFSVIPEVDVNLGYQFTECFSVHVGYSAMYVTNVLWAGKQIDPNINTTQSILFDFPNPQPPLVGPESPRARMRSEGLWVQGLNVGVQFTF